VPGERAQPDRATASPAVKALVEGHNIAHGRGFYTRPSHPTDPIGGAR
jgi:hypothetical protein